MLKRFDCVCHGRMLFQWMANSVQQPLFEDSKLFVDGQRFVKKLDHFRGAFLAPYLRQRAATVVQLRDRKTKKRKGASLLEMDPQQLILYSSFNNKVPR